MSRTQPIAKVMTVASFVALGIGAAWCTVAAWTLMAIMAAFQSQEDYEQLQVTMTGEPVIVRTSRKAGEPEQFHDLAGQAVKTTRQDLLYPQYLQHPDQLESLNMRDWSYRITGANDGGTPAVYWYLIHDGRVNGRAHGVGYHSKSNLIVGYFGREGFRDTPPPPEDCFNIAGDQGLYGAVTTINTYQPGFWRGTDSLLPLLADQKLWVIDVANRQVKMLLDCPSGEQLGAVWRLPKEVLPPNPDDVSQQAQAITPSDIIIRQPDSVVVVNQRNGDHTTFTLPPDCRHAMLSAFLLGDRSLLLVAVDLRRWRDGHEVVRISSGGEVLKREHIRLAGQSGGELEAAFGWMFAAVMPAPVATATMAAVAPAAMTRSGQAESYGAGVSKLLFMTWPSMVAVILVGIACGVLAYRRQKRFGLPHPVAWAVFAFVGGVPAWLAYRFHRVWPVLEECPACHQSSPRDRVNCLDCGKAFPGPALKGIEVFA